MSDKELISALIIIIASLLKDGGKPFDMRELKKRVRMRDNVECADLINRWVRSEMGREALKRHLLDGMVIERVAEEIDRSPRQTARILNKAKDEIEKHI